MMRRLVSAAWIALLATGSQQALAQWPTYRDATVPRLPSGEPDLEAPTPRTADGRPDFSGLWESRRGAIGRPPGGLPGVGTDSLSSAPPPPPPPPPPPGTPPLATFFDIGANIEGGAPYQQWAKELKDARVANGMKDNPDAHCLPIGYMQYHLHPQPRKMIQTPKGIVIIYESNYGLREIFTDGRSHPGDDAQPWWYGYSVGHWEGDELVVESTHFRDDMWLDVNGSPLTDQATIIERFRRPNFGSLEIDITIDDPKAYTKPFTVRVNQQILVDEELIEFICNENEKSSIHFDP
jgi:hypothetical protein